MKTPFSAYLEGIAPGAKRLVKCLKERYEYVSILCTDSVGFRAMASQRQVSVTGETMTTERGCVVRVYRDGLYSEYAFDRFDPSRPEETARELCEVLDRQLALLKRSGTAIYPTGLMEDGPAEVRAFFETGTLPEECDIPALIGRLTALSGLGMKEGRDMVDVRATLQSTHISKMFLTENRDMRQSYVYSEGTIVPLAVRDGKTVHTYAGVSGRCGPELADQMEEKVFESVRTLEDLLKAESVEPGEYDVITSPEVTGLIAHEAFGHGVEMDMFVKNRALGREHIGKRVGSDLVTMHEGALCAQSVTGYAFDDEGTPAGDVTEIDHGILKTGICDALSALRLGTKPTGNGKRENFEHKVYTRMTNTLFDSGTSTLEEMIASIRHGYYLVGMESGMEDPKHWGIQCIVERGYEIRDGKLTGKVVAPLVMTGYVPDLLGSVSMLSSDREVFGTGGCGKGYKEWVKVADGGPCLKCRARLG